MPPTVEQEAARLIPTLSGNDHGFASRVWGQEFSVYADRLKAIGFCHQGRILDAGFGFGQWLYPMTCLNSEVCGIEDSQVRVDFVTELLNKMNDRETIVSKGSIESLSFSDCSFDAVFCYGVLFLTDFKKSLSEFCRVLKRDGKLYFTANDLGWYVHCIANTHNQSEAYDPRKMAADSIMNTFRFLEGQATDGQLFIPQHYMRKEAERQGFKVDFMQAEGTISVNETKAKSFYPENFSGYPMVYEALLTKV